MVTATKPEEVVRYALIKLGYVEGVDFIFQSKMFGGRAQKGGLVADFYLPGLNLVISVVGEYWHYNNPSTQARDRLQQLALESSGIRVAYIDATDALKNARYYVEQAILGISYSKFGTI